MTKDKIKVIEKAVLAPFVMLVSCFVLWGLLNNMTDNLVPAFGKIFMMSAVDSSFVQIAFYGAYAVLAIPAAIIIKKFSYRVGVLIGLGLYMVGALGYIPSAIIQSYDMFLVSIFVLACGLSVLETTCNPYVLSLGAKETSIQRLNLAQAFNPLGSLTGIFLAKYLILANLNPATYDDRVVMEPDALNAIQNNELIWVCVPYVGLVLIAFVIWLFFYNFRRPENKAEDGDLNIASSFKKLIKMPRYYWGVIAQFFYVGLQITVWTWTVKYAMTVFGVAEADAAQYYLYSIILFIVCRWISTAIMTALRDKINPAVMLSVFALAGILACLGTIYLPSTVSIWFLVAVSGCMSLMFPTIYGIALYGMGDEVKLGAAGLIMAILGGAVITPIMGMFIDKGWLNSLLPSTFSVAEASVRSSFYIAIICFVVVLAYGMYIIASNKK